MDPGLEDEEVRAFGLPKELFTPAEETQEQEEEFTKLIKKTIPDEIERNRKLAKHLNEVLGEVEKRRGLRGKKKSGDSTFSLSNHSN
jgi:hypothetical protein